MKVLIVEDSSRLRRSLQQGLKRSGFAVDLAADGEEGLALARVNRYDAVVLDLMLPGLDGLTVLERLRAADSSTPVLILSAKDRVDDRVRGLERGADDYLVKPFSFDELIARLRALTRRRYESRNPLVQLGDVELNTARKQVTRAREVVKLTPNEYAVFEYLVLNRGRVASKDRLLDLIHDHARVTGSNLIEVIVSNLRRKLNDRGDASLIKTRRGHGYLIE